LSNSIALDSDEETETEDNKDNDRIQRSNKNGSAYERAYPFFVNHRNTTSLSYGIIDEYHSSTVLDPFARSGNPMDHHHYRQRPDIDKYVLNLLTKHFIRFICLILIDILNQ
jgi:hypothetical protein